MTSAFGGDVQAIAPVAEAIEAFGQRYLDRVFSAAEQIDLERADAATLTERYAAKEAILKLLGGADGVDLRWIEVLGIPGTRLRVGLRAVALDRHRRSGLGPICLSLSHGGGVAFAVAIAPAVVAEVAVKVATRPGNEISDPTRIL